MLDLPVDDLAERWWPQARFVASLHGIEFRDPEPEAGSPDVFDIIEQPPEAAA